MSEGASAPSLMKVLDHTEPDWARRYSLKGRENGAATYSREIVAHHLPVWRDILPDDAVVSTCRLLDDPTLIPESRLVVQYLHTYPYARSLDAVRRVAAAVGDRTVVFVTAYRPLARLIGNAGFRAVYVPAAVDPAGLAAIDRTKLYGEGRVVYFGNVTTPKKRLYQVLVSAFRRSGWTVDTISGRGQQEAWRQAAAYTFGIGVGRCALELMELGVRPMIAGREFGGIITSRAEFECQLATNLNGRIVTYDRNPSACIAAFDLAADIRPDWTRHLASLPDRFREAV